MFGACSLILLLLLCCWFGLVLTQVQWLWGWRLPADYGERSHPCKLNLRISNILWGSRSLLLKEVVSSHKAFSSALWRAQHQESTVCKQRNYLDFCTTSFLTQELIPVGELFPSNWNIWNISIISQQLWTASLPAPPWCSLPTKLYIMG